MKKIYIKTFGCQMNEYDSQRILSNFSEIGIIQTDNPEDADYAIINTCSVREKPNQKVKSEIGRLKRHKVKNSSYKIGVCGCVAQQEGEHLLSSNKNVDFVIGTDSIDRIGEIVDMLEQGERVCSTKFSTDQFSIPVFQRSSNISAFVTIMKGCDNFCSYCIVPYVRGREVSRKPSEILDEIRFLSDKGVKEVTLLGQNVNSYGKNLDENVNFPKLLYMVSEISGIDRVRFVTSHPKDFSEELIDVIASSDKICEYLHIPLQSGDDSILKAMGRGYSCDSYMGKIQKAKEKIKGLALSSDFIVGFPGESEENFNNSLKAIMNIEYESIFAFKYSVRPKTAAASLEDDVSDEVKSDRLDRLLNVQQKITDKLLKNYIGNTCEILVEGISKKDSLIYSGRNRQNRIVNFAADKPVSKGELVKVNITQAKKNSLFGEYKSSL